MVVDRSSLVDPQRLPVVADRFTYLIIACKHLFLLSNEDITVDLSRPANLCELLQHQDSAREIHIAGPDLLRYTIVDATSSYMVQSKTETTTKLEQMVVR